jgi:hypothetical protein
LSILAVDEIRKCLVATLHTHGTDMPPPSTSYAAPFSRNDRTIDAVTLDFALWNLAKEQEFQRDLLPHHRTRSIYY